MNNGSSLIMRDNMKSIEFFDRDNLEEESTRIKEIINQNTSLRDGLNINEKAIFVRNILNDLKCIENKSIFYKLLESYKYYPLKTYPDLVKKAYCNFREELPEKKVIYLLPAISRQNNKVNSGLFMEYLMQGFIDFINIEKDMKRISFHRKYQYTKADIERMQNESSLVLLIDDFIGTGDSIRKSQKYWKEQIGIKPEHCLTLVAMEYGYQSLQNDVVLFVGEVVKSVENIDIQEIQKIAKKLGIESEGEYFDSTTLVTMLRTPNNTSPIFWRKPKIRGGSEIFRR